MDKSKIFEQLGAQKRAWCCQLTRGRGGRYNRGMETITEIEKQLRDAIQANGQSLNQLGTASGVDAGRLSRFMRGERGLSIEAVGRLCQALGLHFCPLAKAANTSKPPPPKSKAAAKRTAKRKEK